MISNFLNSKNFKEVRFLLILINDLLILNFSIYFSYYLRIEFFISFFEIKNVHFFASTIYLLLFFIFKIPKQYFRYFSSNSYFLYFKLFVSYLVIFGIYVLIQHEDFIPRSLIIIFPSFFSVCLVFNRILISKFFQNK